MVVIDPVTLEPWETRNISLGVNLGNGFGNQNDNGTWFQIMSLFTYPQANATYLNSFQNLINNIVPDSHYILIYSPGNSAFASGIWNTSLSSFSSPFIFPENFGVLFGSKSNSSSGTFTSVSIIVTSSSIITFDPTFE